MAAKTGIDLNFIDNYIPYIPPPDEQTATVCTAPEFIDGCIEDHFSPPSFLTPPDGVHIDYSRTRILMTIGFTGTLKGSKFFQGYGHQTAEFNFAEGRSFLRGFRTPEDSDEVKPFKVEYAGSNITEVRCHTFIQRAAYETLFRIHPKLRALANDESGYPVLSPPQCVEELQKLSPQSEFLQPGREADDRGGFEDKPKAGASRRADELLAELLEEPEEQSADRGSEDQPKAKAGQPVEELREAEPVPAEAAEARTDFEDQPKAEVRQPVEELREAEPVPAEAAEARTEVRQRAEPLQQFSFQPAEDESPQAARPSAPSSAKPDSTKRVSRTVFQPGEGAFYEDPEYEKKTQEDFARTGLVSPIHKVQIPDVSDRPSTSFLPDRIQEAAKLSFLPSAAKPNSIKEIFPEFISEPWIKRLLSAESPESLRLKLLGIPDWKFKRVSIFVKGILVDAMLVVKETNQPERWAFITGGNEQTYESQLQNGDFFAFLDRLKSNAILFNPPSVNQSMGEVNSANIIRSALAVLIFLQTVIKATQIIFYGFSLGGGVQGEVLKYYIPGEGVRYVAIKDRTFKNLTAVSESVLKSVAGILASLVDINALGWDIDPYSSSSVNLKHPELIIQSSLEKEVQYLERADQIADDGVILAVDSLAFAMFNGGVIPKNTKILGVPYGHCKPIWTEPLLSSSILEFLDMVDQKDGPSSAAAAP